MGKLVVLKFEHGNFQEDGFRVRLQVGEDNGSGFSETVIEGNLPPNLKIPQFYEDWQLCYQQLECYAQNPKSYLKQCQEANDKLIGEFNNWLIPNNRKFLKLREKLIKQLPEENEEIRVLIQAEDSLLRKLPWNEWDLFTDNNYSNFEIAISPIEFSSIKTSFTAFSRKKGRVLVIWDEVDINSLRKKIIEVSDTEPIFLQQPQPAKVYQRLQDEQGWDIIFFTGNSWRQNINIYELKQALEKAIAQGLYLVIFNDGLERAEQLADLDIGQMIVMGQVIPDQVAQKFLVYFLQAFANRKPANCKPLYYAVREARDKLEPFNREIPGITWLPVLWQHFAQKPLTWQELRGRTDLSGTRPSPREVRDRQILLNKVKDKWIEGVLERSLYQRVLIELGLEERDDVGTQTLYSSKLFDRFNNIKAGRTLLILGEAGSGKTITLLVLARELIKRVKLEVNLPIPVVFNLSSWALQKQKNPTITDWLLEEMKIQYKIPEEIAWNWIQKEQLILLLDGLDELPQPKPMASCIQALNEFARRYVETDIVVCRRSKYYESLNQQLEFKAAVYLKPLSHQQIQDYLTISANLAGLATALQADTTLEELATKPLMLHIMSVAYHGYSARNIPLSSSIEECRSHLFDTYVERMFHRYQHRRLMYKQQEFLYWLAWLARRMSEETRTIFYIEQLQPRWLEDNSQRKLYALVFSTILGTIVAVLSVLVVWVSLGLFIGEFWGIAVGLILGLFFGFLAAVWARLTLAKDQKISPMQNLKWSRSTLVKSIAIGLVGGVIIWLLSKMIIFLIVGPLIVLASELRDPKIPKTDFPNQGIIQSRNNAILLAMLGSAVLGILAGLMHKQLLGIIVGETYIQARSIAWMQKFTLRAILSGIIVGLFFGLTEAGVACIQHLSLRLILCLKGYTPWNYARFLDSACERAFLQKVGGGYTFIHLLLRDYFERLN